MRWPVIAFIVPRIFLYIAYIVYAARLGDEQLSFNNNDYNTWVTLLCLYTVFDFAIVVGVVVFLVMLMSSKKRELGLTVLSTNQRSPFTYTSSIHTDDKVVNFVMYYGNTMIKLYGIFYTFIMFLFTVTWLMSKMDIDKISLFQHVTLGLHVVFSIQSMVISSIMSAISYTSQVK